MATAGSRSSHFVVVPERSTALAKTFGRTHVDYARHCAQDAAELLHMGEWRKQYTVERWRDVLRTSVAEDSAAERLREATVRGRPFGGEEFVDELEPKAERRLRPLAVGARRKERTIPTNGSACNCGLELVFECPGFPGFLSQ